MSGGDCVFPCYPVAMLTARDISVRFTTSGTFSTTFTRSVTEHASTGGGFLLFSGSKSKTSSFSASSVHSSSTDNTITLRFDTPQIIGYYLECTHADESSLIDDVSGDRDAGFVTIAEFVEAYQKILQEINNTYKKAN